jgi:hypothetical protein
VVFAAHFVLVHQGLFAQQKPSHAEHFCDGWAPTARGIARTRGMNSIILYGGAIGNGNIHNHDKLPMFQPLRAQN